MTDKHTPCETLKAIVDSQVIEISAAGLINLQNTITDIADSLNRSKPQHFSMNRTVLYDDYWSISRNIGKIHNWLDYYLTKVELPAHYKPIVKELIEQAQNERQKERPTGRL